MMYYKHRSTPSRFARSSERSYSVLQLYTSRDCSVIEFTQQYLGMEYWIEISREEFLIAFQDVANHLLDIVEEEE